MSDPKPSDDRPITFLEWIGLSDEPDLGRARWVGIGVGIFLALVFAGAVIVAIIVMIGTARDVMGGAGTGPNLGAGALIAALLGAPFLIWSTIIKHRELGFQKEGHLTDRISAAVEQLGAEKTVKRDSNEHTEPNIEVRIGGILSLERIAQDSTNYDKGRDHVRVMEILCAYVRHNAQRGKDDSSTEAPPPRIDIQKALDVIKRRGKAGRDIEAQQRFRLDLRDTDLRGYDLSRGDFVGAVFWRSNLAGVTFAETDLTATRLDACVLDRVDFYKARLRGTILNFAQMDTNSTFGGLNLVQVEAVFIEAAILPRQNIATGDRGKYFGSAETVLPQALLDQVRANGLAVSDINDVDQHIEQVNVSIDSGAGFHHWNPFSIHDGGSIFYSNIFKQKHNLIGWPFDD